MERLLSRWQCDFLGPSVDNRLAIEVAEVRDDPLLEFGLRRHPDVTQYRAHHLREEALNQVEPGAMLWREHEAEAPLALWGEPLLRFLRHMRRMIVQDQLYRGIGRVGRIEPLEKADEFARAVAVFDAGMYLSGK